jgi:hypothetical protein
VTRTGTAVLHAVPLTTSMIVSVQLYKGVNSVLKLRDSILKELKTILMFN